MPNLPQARTADILEMEADGELMIYDLRNNKAYNLNETSKAVYRACGSNVSFEELKRTFKFTDDLIHFALNELAANNLLEAKVGNYFAGLNRREVIRRVGLASIIALPVITGIVAPTAAHAASGCIASGEPTSGSFNGNFGPALNSQVCIDNLRARCCSGTSVGGGCGCNPANVGALTTCTGSVTCG